MIAARRLAALFSCALPLLSSAARAQEAPATLSESLFQDARELLEKGEYSAACPKLAESYRLDPATGTLLALAICHEQEGKLASAWAEYSAVIAAARKAGDPAREVAAEARTRALKPRLSTLTVRLRPETAALPGLKVRLDGVELGAAVLSQPIRVDGGEHVVEVSAGGRRPFRGVVTVQREQDAQLVDVPELEPAPRSAPTVASALPGRPAPAAAGAAPPSPSEAGAWRRPVAYAAAGVGLLGIGVGSYFGLRAITKSADARAVCGDSGPCADAGARGAADDAKASASVSTVAFTAGLAAALFGTWAYLTAPVASSASGAGVGLRVAPARVDLVASW